MSMFIDLLTDDEYNLYLKYIANFYFSIKSSEYDDEEMP